LVTEIPAAASDLRVHPDSRSRPHILYIALKKYFPPKSRRPTSILKEENRLTSGGGKMTTDEIVVDVSQDWVLACDVQQGFMHASRILSDSFDHSARCRQVRALGGDCYNLIPLNDDRLAIVIGDASGKGLAAALMIANVQSSLRTAALFSRDDLGTLLKIVNQHAYASTSEDRYATLFYGVFDGSSRTLRYVNAGHNPPVVIRRDGSMDCLETSGAPVGLFADSEYAESSVKL
jgi:sigma-B regulation protein RsbU (phosphoserine phosphatase)